MLNSADLKPLVSTRFKRFLLVGLSNAAISFVVFYTFYHLLVGLPLRTPAAQTLSYGAGIVWSFYHNRRWTFTSNGSLFRQGAGFLLSQLALMALSVGLLSLVIDQLNWPPSTSWLLVMGFITLLNYWVQKHLVFNV